MNRKWTVVVSISAVALSLLLLGCPKKKPVAPPEPEPVPAPVAPPPAEEVTQPEAPEPMDATPPLMSKDLREVNAYVTSQGLIGDVFFDFDKYNLKPEARDRLAKNADFMKQHPEFQFTIEGHCDERGTNDYNLALGQRRADAAKDYLAALGVGGSPRTISYGEERPFCTESGEPCWGRNRRAHFVITGRN